MISGWMIRNEKHTHTKKKQKTEALWEEEKKNTFIYFAVSLLV